MKFRLITTHMMYTEDDFYLKKYIEKMDKAGQDGPAYIVKDGKLYVDIFYGSDLFKLAKVLGEELIIRKDEEPTIEIYDDWRE